MCHVCVCVMLMCVIVATQSLHECATRVAHVSLSAYVSSRPKPCRALLWCTVHYVQYTVSYILPPPHTLKHTNTRRPPQPPLNTHYNTQSIEREQAVLKLEAASIGPSVKVLQIDNVRLTSEVSQSVSQSVKGCCRLMSQVNGDNTAAPAAASSS